MFCPQCAAEYREGFDRCADCDALLVPSLPPVDHEAEEYVALAETSEVDVIPVWKSILEGAEIPYLVEGEDLLNLFPSDMLGQIYKSAAEVKFRVPASRAEEARALLTEVPETAEPGTESAEDS